MFRIGFNYLSLKDGHVISNNLVPGLFGNGAVRHLVSEASQNSIDAIKTSSPGTRAHLEFHLRSLKRSALEPFDISSVETHAAACREHDIAKAMPQDDLRILTFEDRSGGLEGPAAHGGDLSTPLGRYTFSVGSGVSGKSGTDNGRHGLGSGSGAIVSKTRCMYFTSTRLDGTTVGSGRVSLATRRIGNESFAPEARLGAFKDGEWQGLLEGDDADLLHLEIGFSRPVDKAGLSCAVIDPVEEINGYSLLANILCWQFLQILNGEIEFTIRDDFAGIEVTVCAENIDEVIASELFLKAQHAIKSKGRPNVQQAALADLTNILTFVRSYPDTGQFPVIAIDKLADIAPDLRKTWLQGDPVGIVFPISGVHSETGSASGTIGVWVKPLKTGTGGFDIHVRDSIMNITKANNRMSLTVSANDACSVLLGDAEDPSHMKYLETYARKRGWVDCSDALRAFKGAPDSVAMAMAGEANKGDRMALARFFPMPGKDIKSTSAGGASDDKSDDVGAIIVEGDGGTDEVFLYKPDRRSSSLTLTLTPTAKKACEDGTLNDIEILAEYAGSRPGRGSFTDTNSTFSVEGCSGRYEVSGNRLVVYDVASDLKVIIRNIDLNRDLRIRNDNAESEDAA